ncbi:MAG TPA: VWA domain-containing protein [Trueperaceae bacterium]
MTFLWPNALLLAPLLLGTALFTWWLADRRRARSAGKLADERLYPSVVRPPLPSRTRSLRLLQLLALAVLLLAAARPQASPPLPANKAAVVIALDASRSMLADDVDPNRLEVARNLAKQFVESAPASALLGLASFSDSAFVLVPPTNAGDELLAALERVQATSNTSLAAAIVAGVRMLPGRGEAEPPESLSGAGRDLRSTAGGGSVDPPEPLPPGRILVLSDGVSNVSANPGLPANEALELALDFAEEQEVQVYTVPVGSVGGAVTHIDGQDYFIPFDGETLELMSERTGGQRLDAGDPEGLREAFRDLGREIRWEAAEVEISALLTGVALILLLIAATVGLRTSRRLP